MVARPPSRLARSLPWSRLLLPWSNARQRRRLLTIAGTVAVLVTVAHRLVPGGEPRLWGLFHALIPATAFSLGAWSSGARRPTPGGILRGASIVLLVLLAFGTINRQPLPLPVTFALNLLVPLLVSTAGAVSAQSAAAESPAGPGGASSGRLRTSSVATRKERT